MNFSFRSFALVLVAAFGLSGCINDQISVSRDRVAFISAPVFSTGGDTYATRPLGAFYRASGLAVNFGVVEECIVAAYTVIPPTVATFPTVAAGPHLYTDMGGRLDTLFPTSTLGFQTYQLLSVNAIPYIPGDTLTVEVPGDAAGFPAATIRVRTAEAFDFNVPTTVAEGEPLRLTWTPAPAPGSTMTVSLRLNNAGTGTEPDTQIYCRFNDDGAGEVSAAISTLWRVAEPASRSTLFTRIRYTTIEFDARTRLSLLSYFDRPTTPIPN